MILWLDSDPDERKPRRPIGLLIAFLVAILFWLAVAVGIVVGVRGVR